MSVGPLQIDFDAKSITVDKEPVSLTPREYAILELLLRNRGRVISRMEIEREVYDEQVEPMSNVVDSAICALRRKVDHSQQASLIQTRRGLGYVVPREPA
jgi:DNA-binding response OmpR family regulator